MMADRDVVKGTTGPPEDALTWSG